MSAFIWDGFSRKQHASTFAPGGGFVLFTPLQLLRHLRWAAPSLAFQARPWEVDPSGASEEEEVQVPSEMPDPKKQLASPWPPHLYVGGRWAPRVSKGRNPPLALWQELAFYENGGRKLSQGEPVLPKAPSSLSSTAHLRWQRSRLPSLGFCRWHTPRMAWTDPSPPKPPHPRCELLFGQNKIWLYFISIWKQSLIFTPVLNWICILLFAMILVLS